MEPDSTLMNVSVDSNHIANIGFASIVECSWCRNQGHVI